MYQRLLVPIDGARSPTRASTRRSISRERLAVGSVCSMSSVICRCRSTTGATALSPARFGTTWRTLRRRSLRRQEQGRAGGVAVDVVKLDGSADRLVEHVLHQIGKWGADLIVLGTHGRSGLGRLLLGSHAEKILRAATVPVLLVRAREPKKADETVASSVALPAAPVH
ncbi:MAG: universal stress protein [Ramlibacter sp.]|nr:universal stress protein [Ramlibacter sp.]